MELEKKYFNQICERCENHSSADKCECMMSCPAFKLYCLAKKKKEVVYKKDDWSEPPTPRPEMI